MNTEIRTGRIEKSSYYLGGIGFTEGLPETGGKEGEWDSLFRKAIALGLSLPVAGGPAPAGSSWWKLQGFAKGCRLPRAQKGGDLFVASGVLPIPPARPISALVPEGNSKGVLSRETGSGADAGGFCKRGSKTS